MNEYRRFDIFSIWDNAGYIEPSIEEYFGNSDENEPNKTIITLPLVEKEDLYHRGDINDKYELITIILIENSHLTLNEIADKARLTRRQVERIIKKMIDCGLIIRQGSKKTGSWLVKK